MSHDGVTLRAVMRSVAFLTAGLLAVPALAGCGSPGLSQQAKAILVLTAVAPRQTFTCLTCTAAG
ncbi:hypothetical protein AB0O67_35545, partial [Streptomyces sp. NPDC086077]|uniref:hypothetical protein n=1 Tax=Streptomyces sp. NPDC086077 TaxID=3154862 RepID=UPI0034368623